MGKASTLPDVRTINAAVAGEPWAVERVIEYYSGEIDRLCRQKVKQPDGSVKEITDEDMRQALVLKLIESLSDFKAE